MKIRPVRASFVNRLAVLTLLVALVALLGGIRARKAPDERWTHQPASLRARPSPLDIFRREYRAHFQLPYREPVDEDPILGNYPSEITQKVAKLSLFGTDRWESSFNLKEILHSLSADYLGLLSAQFHPQRIEMQSQDIREQHFRASQQMVEWMNTNMEPLEVILGQERANNHLQYYSMVRDLAALAKDIPTR
ncbi:uncharacterized protein SRS1_25032 [Sporisorium reilianum f. sp. reilianum]|uniref:Uncharacterized protein n=1 Tax=Sporisorium reilianum f. sp. reilianum TaxID=72559 RepID=A0A2N8UHI9_9BASI|nr:uncharacterized protein SRS1_25032 [Sporisorium reilianum f. sp. reilianum]